MQVTNPIARELYKYSKEGNANVIELALPDTLDSSEFDRLNEGMLDLIAPAADKNWVIDLTASHYVGSAVLGLLVNLRQRIFAARGRLYLSGLSPRLAEIFHATSLERLFTLCRTKSDAIRRAG